MQGYLLAIVSVTAPQENSSTIENMTIVLFHTDRSI